MEYRIWLAILLVYLVDWLLLMGINTANGDPVQPIVTAAAALAGAVYAVLCIFAGFDFLGNMFWRIVVLTLIGALAFGFCVRKTAQFLLADIAINGVATGLGRGDWRCLIFGVIMIISLLILAHLVTPRGKQVAVRVQGVQETVSFLALYDTGNLLKDPITGIPVLVASSTLCEKLLGIKPEALADPTACVSGGKGLRLLPFHTVGGGGLLVAKRFENVYMNGRNRPMLVAFSPNEIGAGKSFCALTGGI